MEHILVTGGAGFIGSHTVDALLERGYFVSVVDNLSTGKRSNLKNALQNPQFALLEGELQYSLESCFELATQKFGKIERIIHLAAQTSTFHSVQNPLFDSEINYNTTYKIMEYARRKGIQKVVYASSAAIYGDIGLDSIPEEVNNQPLSPYGIDKYASEMVLRYYHAVHQLPSVPLRFFNVFGPRQDPKSPYSGVISIFIERAILNQTIQIFGDGKQTRDFIFVKDVVQGILQALFGKVVNGAAFNLGTGQTTTVNQLAQEIISLSKSSSSVLHGEARMGDIVHSCSNIEKAQKELSFSPNYSLAKGLLETIEWYKGE